MLEPEYASFLNPLLLYLWYVRDLKLPIAPTTTCILMTPRKYLQTQFLTEV